MNILIKLTCLIGLVIAPILGLHSENATAMNTQEVEINVSIDTDYSEYATASITSVTTKNGVETIVKKSYYGTEDEVEKLIEDRIKEVKKK